DDYTVEFTLAQPNVLFLIKLVEAQHSIVPKHVLAGMTADQVNKSDFKTKSPVGTGPFTVAQVVPDQFVEFDANPGYFGGAPKLDKIIYKTITPETATAQIQSGELDIFLAAGASNFDLLSSNASLDVRSIVAPGIFTFQFNSETQEQRDKWKTDLNLSMGPINFDFSDK